VPSGLSSTEATPEEAELLRSKYIEAFAENIRVIKLKK
jgi:hypothetical protein